MADRSLQSPTPATTTVRSTPEADEAERLLGRIVGIGLPSVTVLGAIVVGALASVGSALLVLAAGTLLGTISLLWASLRTLSGDAPLPAELEALAAQRTDVDALAESKRRALRALKDLESEYALGRIDDADYETFVSRYRDEAKSLMRQMDAEVAPARVEAERLARAYIAERTVRGGQRAHADASRRERIKCPACGGSNEWDATFCKQCGSGIENPGEPHEATT